MTDAATDPTALRDLRASVGRAVAAAEPDHRALLQSIVRTAHTLFDAAASSICLVDDTGRDLVFEAVSGAGEDDLVGHRFPATEGIAGWVLQAEEPVLVSDVATNRSFSRRVALETGYVPTSILAAPLIHEDEPIGVLEVLDHRAALPGSLQAIDLLVLVAEQASIALGVVRRSRRLHRYLEPGAAPQRLSVGDLAALVGADGQGARGAAGRDLLRAIEAVLAAR